MEATLGSWHVLGAHNNGLSYQTVRDLVIDPNDSSRVYAGTERGVFRSTDGGENWEPTNAD